jgi:hypothetical protein
MNICNVGFTKPDNLRANPDGEDVRPISHRSARNNPKIPPKDGGGAERPLSQRNETNRAPKVTDPGVAQSARPVLTKHRKLPREKGAFERGRWPIYYCG